MGVSNGSSVSLCMLEKTYFLRYLKKINFGQFGGHFYVKICPKLELSQSRGNSLLVGHRNILRLKIGSLGTFEGMCQKNHEIRILNARN